MENKSEDKIRKNLVISSVDIKTARNDKKRDLTRDMYKTTNLKRLASR